MKLSEAIRLGAMLHPQCFGSMYLYVNGGLFGLPDSRVASCALGAANAAGYPDVFESQREPVVWLACPVCATHRCLINTISHLNDQHRWMRERIADWVETLEVAAAPEPRATAEPANI